MKQNSQKQEYFWASSCLKKKKLRSEWADRIVVTAKNEGSYLRKYLCPHCMMYHVTSKQPKSKDTESLAA